MRQKPSISTSDMASVIGISQRKVFENIRILKQKGKIIREGSAKSGHWTVLD